MKRRNLLTAALAAPLAAVPAVAAAETDTPVMRAYREWKRFSAWVNGPETRGYTDEQIEDLAGDLTRLVTRVVDAPLISDRDMVMKFLTVVSDYQLFIGIPELERLEAEARALVGQAA